MLTLSHIIQVAGFVMFLVGCFLAIKGVSDLLDIKDAKEIEATIIDHVQEYTARGFLWKAKVQYIWNNQRCFHVMRSRTLKRGTDTIKIYLDKSGRVIEKRYSVSNILFGVLVIALSLFVFSVASSLLRMSLTA